MSEDGMGLVFIGLLLMLVVGIVVILTHSVGVEPVETFTVFTEFGPMECREADGGGYWCSRLPVT